MKISKTLLQKIAVAVTATTLVATACVKEPLDETGANQKSKEKKEAKYNCLACGMG